MADNKSPKAERWEALEELGKQVGAKEKRKIKARRETQRTVWFGLGMFGLVGWSVAMPTVVGAVLGIWIDSRWPSRISWTLTLLFVGIILGCLNAWFWVKRQGGHE
ncbi:MAG: AtpZ/AtpI family protein [Desulfobacterales bacterium]|nr:AtpZ/AtpI family protein [Desulfobacterales bacterium]